MSLPSTYRAYRRTSGSRPLTIIPSIETLQSLSLSQVLIKIHAVSLNFRDIGMLDGRYPISSQERGIPCSDCAGEVAAVGTDVKRFRIGDRVSPCFNIGDLFGKERDGVSRTLGADVGVLGEYAVFEEEEIVRVSALLSWEEAAIIPCCGVTAWNALNRPKTGSVQPDTTALLQGTGGVSMFALQICLAAGITPIITSSQDEKLEAIEREFGVGVKGINYRTSANMIEDLRLLTDGKGVDIVVNNTGPASLMQELQCLRQKHGTISLVGFLEDKKADWDPNAMLGLMIKCARIQGIRVGSKSDFEELICFLEEKNIRLESIVYRTFEFDDAPAAFEYLAQGKHVGKIVIRV
ncbi:hypothetical protein BCR34DRAFT_581365 [Clohesyomyces aquaticus]|uniref:Enoyl reductase (ER) domain-containing protein n=1 Tax=Clohesyomyces aquaticus TaxID=1231657 RepID=A0A1Y1Y161_9PLEO|nr:hypothetical protein BCR34DRAFT_581365 [Clohesyomyces aquaticus]